MGDLTSGRGRENFPMKISVHFRKWCEKNNYFIKQKNAMCLEDKKVRQISLKKYWTKINHEKLGYLKFSHTYWDYVKR